MKTHLILKKYLEKKKASHPGFSLRVLARELDLSAPFLSRIFNGQKSIPFPILLKLEKALDIDIEVFASLKKAHQTSQGDIAIPVRGKGAEVKTELQEWDLADKSKFNILRQWFYVPILEATNLTNYDGSAKTIAKRLKLSLTTVEIAIREMISAGVLEEKKGLIRKTNKKLRFASSKSLASIRNFHEQMMTRAQAELREATGEDDFARRLITGITVTTTPDKIAGAKQKLAECLHEIANDMDCDEGTEIYQLAAQLFPLTKE